MRGKRWTTYYDKCIKCSKTKTPHQAYGYCRTCHWTHIGNPKKEKAVNIEFYCNGCKKKCLLEGPFTDIMNSTNYNAFKSYKAEYIDKCKIKI